MRSIWLSDRGNWSVLEVIELKLMPIVVISHGCYGCLSLTLRIKSIMLYSSLLMINTYEGKTSLKLYLSSLCNQKELLDTIFFR